MKIPVIRGVTEADVDLEGYVAKKAAGSVLLVKDLNGNFLYQTNNKTFDLATETIVTVTVTQNINRVSVADVKTQLAAARAKLDALDADVAAAEADMDALDAA